MTKELNVIETSFETQVDVPDGTELRQYVAPKLAKYGDVRDVIMGGTLGTLDTGNPGVERP